MKREIKQELSFKENGTFESYYKACKWLKDNGYSYGDTACSRSHHCGILKGEGLYIPKFYHLKNKEIALLDGIMTSLDYREGEVRIILYK